MLVLTRTEGEKILISDNQELCIEIVVVRVKGNEVRLGINAPQELNIVRDELLKTGESK